MAESYRMGLPTGKKIIFETRIIYIYTTPLP